MKNSHLKLLLASALLFSSLVASVSSSTSAALADAVATPAAMSYAPTQLPSHRWVGFYVPDVPWQMAPLTQVQNQVGFSAVFSNYFQNVVDKGFSTKSASNLVAQGTVPLLTLEFRDVTKGPNQPAYSLKSIANGSCDTYLRKFASDAKAFGRTVWLRPFHEMNGYWYPWCGTVNGNQPSDFVPAWQHVHQIFTDAGATNVKFVWCPNIESLDANHSLKNSANAISRYWPGDQYVDYIALDGYNFGTAADGGWRSFSKMFSAPYNEVSPLSDKPILVAETSCATCGGNKATWIRDAFRVIPASFPRIVGVGWFDTNADRDWRVDSSSASLAAFRSATQNSVWSDRSATSLTIKSSVKRAKRGRAFHLSGTLRPSNGGDQIRLYVRRKGSKRWTMARVTINASGGWRYRSKLKTRGTYSYYARFSTASTRWGSTSRTVAVSVR